MIPVASASGVAVHQGDLLVADGPCLRRFSLEGVQKTAHCVNGANLGRMAVSASRVYAADSYGSMVHVFDAASLNRIGGAVLPGNPDGLAIADGVLYVAADDAGLMLLRDAAPQRHRAVIH